MQLNNYVTKFSAYDIKFIVHYMWLNLVKINMVSEILLFFLDITQFSKNSGDLFTIGWRHQFSSSFRF